MKRTIQHQLYYPHPPEEVWEWLTRSELIAQWLMPNDFQPEVGREFQFTTRPMPQFEFDGHIFCQVLEIDPCRKLIYSWKGGPGDGSFNLDSVVSFTLIPKEQGTELLLEHSGMMENINIYNAMNIGWLKNIQKILDLIHAPEQTTKRN
jgi:uncharacterized protein YndB with AHSA1/START domain